MENVRTVAETKQTFYSLHRSPIHSLYRQIVDELIVEMHLLSVNVDFRYDPFYALGVVTTFEGFMTGYAPEADKASIFQALCRSVGAEPQQYQQDAAHLRSSAKELVGPELLAWLTQEEATILGPEHLQGLPQMIANRSSFKYSRLFGIGLLTFLETVAPEWLQDAEKRQETLQKVSDALHLSAEKLQKDLELYQSNLEKMVQAQKLLQEVIEADRKKREQRAGAKVVQTASTEDVDVLKETSTPEAPTEGDEMTSHRDTGDQVTQGDGD